MTELDVDKLATVLSGTGFAKWLSIIQQEKRILDKDRLAIGFAYDLASFLASEYDETPPLDPSATVTKRWWL